MNEIIQTEKHKYLWSRLYLEFKEQQQKTYKRLIHTESKLMFARLKGVGRWVKTVKGLRSTKWQLENSHRMWAAAWGIWSVVV